MPRLHILRLLSLIPLFYLTLIGLWIFLPSPIISPASRPAHIQSVLTSGSQLVTVHPDSPALKYDTHRSNGETNYLAITYQLATQRSRFFTYSLFLHIDDAKLNLTDYFTKPAPHLDPSPFKVNVRPGSTDHIINLPWFHVPDAILFHHHMHGFPADVNLRVLVPEAEVVEIWMDSAAWSQFDFYKGFGQQKEMFDRISKEDRETGMLIRLRNRPVAKGVGVEMVGMEVEYVKGELTSRTFGFRMWMLGPLGPVPTVVLFLVEAVIWPGLVWAVPRFGVVMGLYAVIVLLWWALAGRPRFSGWVGESVLLWPLRRVLECVGVRSKPKEIKKSKKMIWTAAGPAYESEDEDTESGNGGHPRTFGKRLDEMLKGVRGRNRSVDIEASEPTRPRSHSNYE